MSRFHFSIASLLFVLALSAVVIAAFTSGTMMYTRLLYTFALLANCIAVIALINCSGVSRSFWIGFAIVGWAYFVAVHFSPSELRHDRFVSSDLELLFEKFATHSSNIITDDVAGLVEEETNISILADSICQLVLSVFGGAVGVCFFRKNKRASDE